MKFLDRTREMERLRRGLDSEESWLCVLWGRRRVGKSRLVLEWLKKSDGIYFVADQSAAPLQRSYFAVAVATRFPGFADVSYPDWRSVLERLASQAMASAWRGPLVLDEFPYLVQSDGALPSIMQNWIDTGAKQGGLKVVLSGSSQRMMQGLVLDATAPLYGRASETISLKTLPPGVIGQGLGLTSGSEMATAYAVWGGTPRYWELAGPFGENVGDAVDNLVLDPLGPLHHEPDRLLLEETPSALSLRPLLDVIGSGAHRVSEIAGRLGHQATTLARPLSRLQELGLVRREVPFGESERSGKRALYVIDDPFLRMWSRVVAPNRSLLAAAPRSARLALWKRHRQSLFALGWEELCRRSVPFLSATVLPNAFGPARRYWRGNDPKMDIVAESLDGTTLLVGEVKWSDKPFSAGAVRGIHQSLAARGIPRALQKEGRTVHYAVFVPTMANGSRPVANARYAVITANHVMPALRQED